MRGWRGSPSLCLPVRLFLQSGCPCGNMAFRNGNPADGRHNPPGTAEEFRFEAGSCVDGVAAPPCAYLSGCSCRSVVLGGVFPQTRVGFPIGNDRLPQEQPTQYASVDRNNIPSGTDGNGWEESIGISIPMCSKREA
jgi:hypothetical protein